MAKRIVPSSLPALDTPMSTKVLGDYVRYKRTHLGLGIHDAAMLCNVSVSTLSKIETAKGGVIFDKVLQVCHALGIDLRVDLVENNR
jgi:transcriptional regulator with XRE-family HTH domain